MSEKLSIEFINVILEVEIPVCKCCGYNVAGRAFMVDILNNVTPDDHVFGCIVSELHYRGLKITIVPNHHEERQKVIDTNKHHYCIYSDLRNRWSIERYPSLRVDFKTFCKKGK